MKKLIILDHEPYSERKFHHYFISQFQGAEINVEYWDLSTVLDYSKNVQYNNKLTAQFVRNFYDINKVVSELYQLNNLETAVIVEIFPRESTRKIFEALLKQKLYWARINYYHNPTFVLGNKLSFIDKFKKLMSFNFLYKKLLSKLKPTDVFIPNISFLTGDLNSNNNQNVVSLDYFDIEEYKEKQIKSSETSLSPFIVFLDIMFVSHPDLFRHKFKNIDASDYYRKMRRFFDQLEMHFDKEVIIAAHPKSNYSNEFGNRRILKGQTADLVINSSLVVTHGSLSISYALLSKKPLLYVYYNDIKKNKFYKTYYHRMEKACEYL